MTHKTIDDNTTSQDGLRYSSKRAGSPFIDKMAPPLGPLFSCIRCGKHRPAQRLKMIKLAGRNQRACIEDCRLGR